MTTLLERIIASVSDLLALFASLIAIYLFLFKKDKILTAFNLLINYSRQLTLTELKSKIERLNDYNANDEKQKDEVLNILHEIEGQLNGNKTLKTEFIGVLKKVSTYTSARKEISEAYKRSLVSELRENLRNIDIDNYNEIITKKNKS